MPAANTSARELPVIELPDQSAWDEWLESNHEKSDGVWLKFAKKGAPARTLSPREAVETALCHGWIDSQAAPYDGSYWLQRFTRRGPRSKWSQINRARATELIAEQRMRPAGLAQIEAAKSDGRWDAAYEPQSRATVPHDFRRALDEHPAAREFFETLRGVNRYAFLYRIQDAKRPETRAKRIAHFTQMLAEHRTLH